jgi:hypothetical protein
MHLSLIDGVATGGVGSFVVTMLITDARNWLWGKTPWQRRKLENEHDQAILSAWFYGPPNA